MGEVIVMNGLTLDGVMQGPGRPNLVATYEPARG
jgi:hypothetical protein